MNSPMAFSPSPATRRIKVKTRSSLIGFDPLLAPEDAKKNNSTKADDLQIAPMKSLAVLQTAVAKGQHRRDVQSFCVSDLHAINQQVQGHSRNSSPCPTGFESRTPKTPTRSSETKNRAAPAKKSPVSHQNVQTMDSGSTHTRSSSKENKKNSPNRNRRWSLGKTHRKTKSLEIEDPKALIHSAKKDKQDTFMNRDSAINNSFVKDMMDVRFDKLQIPPLAKPSPTSFLTGSEVEATRTSEFEAAPFQTELPSLEELVVSARVNEFVENYRRMDQNFDLRSWKGYTQMDLRQVSMPEHIPIAQLLLDCGDSVILQGVVSSGSSSDDRVEAIAFEDQRHFIAVFRGTTEQQMKPGNCKHKKKSAALDSKQPTIEVYQCFLEEYMKIEEECFTMLDKLRESQPFCEIVFTGHSFGGALATLASFRYANARPTARVKCYPMSSPKVGFATFRQLVNSTPNLRVVRLEYGQDGKSQLPSPAGSHVGHTLVLHGSLGNNSQKTKQPVLVYKFDAPKQKKFKTIHPDLRSYVMALEEVARLKMPWVNEFVGTSGKGVVVNNEARQMV